MHTFACLYYIASFGEAVKSDDDVQFPPYYPCASDADPNPHPDPQSDPHLCVITPITLVSHLSLYCHTEVHL